MFCEFDRWTKSHLHGDDVGLDAGAEDGWGGGGALGGVRRGVGRHDQLDQPPEEPQVRHANLQVDGMNFASVYCVKSMLRNHYSR